MYLVLLYFIIGMYSYHMIEKCTLERYMGNPDRTEDHLCPGTLRTRKIPSQASLSKVVAVSAKVQE